LWDDCYGKSRNIIISKKKYPQIVHRGNVFESTYEEGYYDILIGGSPCTYWSINKKDREITSEGLGFQLFSQYVRALKESKCEYFIYENNHKIHANIEKEITKALGVTPILINSATVSAQQRFRLYWTNIPNITLPSDKSIYLKDIIDLNSNEKNLIKETRFNLKNTSSEKSDKPIRIGTIGKGGQGERVYSIDGKSINLTANGGGRGAKTGLYLIGDVVRKLMPIEAERLQTLPDNYTEGISNNQRYKCIGNGWTVDVIAHILKGLNAQSSQITKEE